MRPEGRSSILAPVMVALVLLGVAGFVVWQVHEGQQLPDGPVPVIWEKDACAHCRMHLSEMYFAVQLQTRDGDVLNCDDPGCFFSYMEAARPDVHEIWFHHSREDRWVRRSEVAFVPAVSTPMNCGLAAVDRDQEGALSYEQARAQVLSRQGAGG